MMTHFMGHTFNDILFLVQLISPAPPLHVAVITYISSGSLQHPLSLHMAVPTYMATSGTYNQLQAHAKHLTAPPCSP